MGYRHRGSSLGRGIVLVLIGLALLWAGSHLGGTFPKDWPIQIPDRLPKPSWGNHDGEETITDLVETDEPFPPGVERLTIKLPFGSVSIRQGIEGSINFINVPAGTLEIQRNGESLLIEQDGWNFSIESGRDSLRPKVEIVLPEGLSLERLEVSIGAGTLVARGIEARHLDIESGAGTVDCESIRAHEVEAKTGAGTITLDLDGNEEDYRVDYARGLGTVTVGERSFTGIGSGSVGRADAPRTVRANTGAGTIRVRFSPRGVEL